MTAHKRLGPYEIERELGRGGMGVVYAARHREHGHQVAIKLLLTRDPEARARFTREATSLARLRHANVVTVHALEESPEGPFLVMDLIEGEGLDARLARGGPCDADEAARIGEDLCLALQAAHAGGILHRDLKPSNVLLEAGTGRTLLTDFGLAHDMTGEEERLTATGHVLGTPSFMAPEQMSGKHGTVDARTDVHGVGTTLYAALTGRAPFRGATLLNIIHAVVSNDAPAPRSEAPKTPADLNAIVLTCMAKDPDDRYPSASALLEDLRRFRAGESVEADAGARPTALTLAASITVGLALMAIALAAWIATRPVPTPTPSPRAPAVASTTPTPAPTPTRTSVAPARPGADERELLARANRLKAKVTKIGNLRWNVLIPLLKIEWDSEFSALPPTSSARRIVRDLYADALYLKTAQPKLSDRLKRSYLLEVLPVHPDHLASLKTLARKPIETEAGLAEALRYANRALSFGPDVVTLTAKAYLLSRLGKPLLALNVVGEAIQLDPTAFHPRLMRGDIYMRMDQYPSALESYTNALERNRRPTALVRRGICGLRLRRFAQAKRDLQEVIRLNPERYPIASAYLGWVFHEAGDSKTGLEHLNRAVDLSPQDSGIRLFRARIRVALGDLKGALADLSHSTSGRPTVHHDPEAPRRLRREIAATLRREAD